MPHSSRATRRGLRDRAGSALRWITAFDPFGGYGSSAYRR
jgi:hypothetical protein